MGKGAISDKDEHSLFAVGLQARDYVMRAFDKADLVITVGYDVAEYDPEFWNRNKDEYYQPEVEIVADVSATLWELNKHNYNGDLKFDRDWYKNVRKRIVDDLESYRLKEGDDFTVPGVLHIIREIMNPGDILISDVGSHKLWIGRNYPVYEPNSVLISNGFASMGIALPGGLAAKLAKPSKQVVTVMGDGGFLMNSQEIETAKRVGIGYTIIVFNDNDYGLISWKQYSHTKKTFGTGLTNPDFKKYAESFGIPAYAPKTLKDLKSDLKKAITGQELCLVEIPIQPGVNYELSEKLERDLS
ncbi:MAG: thiamine pyrophosphate-dependent enzyme [Candidatus Hodarchaeales archaeon]|jgi:acetolactate synthase-1/2/3 large subunit